MYASAARQIDARRSPCPVQPPLAHTVEEAYEAILLGEVARWDDQAAFESLYTDHFDAVRSAALKICRDADVADDIAQQTFTALWIRAERLAAKTLRLRPWLCTVARNAAIDYLRGGIANGPLDAAAELASTEPDPADALISAQSTAALRAALATLSPEQRGAVELVYFSGMTYRAAAEVSGQPQGTLKSRVRLALSHLRQILSR